MEEWEEDGGVMFTREEIPLRERILVLEIVVGARPKNT